MKSTTLVTTLGTVTAAVVALGVPAAPRTAAAASSCSVSWGSAAKTASSTRAGSLTAVRAGQHPCFDRLVLDLTTSGEGYRVRYVSAVRDQGRGAVVPLRGGAFLQVDDGSAARGRPALPDVSGWRTFRQVGWGGSFEGMTTVGLGVRARLPFRVLRADHRLVIDVAHHW
jgi:hypothetical protein